MVGVGDAIHAENLAGQVETGDLFYALVVHAVCFDRAAAHGKNRAKFVPAVIHVVIFLQGSPTLDNFIESVNFIEFQGNGQAERIHAAISAIDFSIVWAALGHGQFSDKRLFGAL